MKNVIFSADAPAAIGPYSQAIKAGNVLYLSGQIGMNPATGELVSDDVKEQTARALQNMKAVLAAAGAGPENVVKTTVFLKDMNDFAAMNEVYAQFFEGPAYPARSAVEVARLPKDVLVEIEAVALL